MTVLKNHRGQGLTEYLVLLMLVAVASISLVAGLGKTIRGKIKEAQNHIDKDISADVSSSDGGGSGGGSGSFSNNATNIINAAFGK